MHVLVRLAALAALVPAAAGCCSMARVMCGIEAPSSPAPTTRDTPGDAVDFLTEALQNDRVAELYESLHPAFVADWGGFTLTEFTYAYDRFEDLFAEDAAVFRDASRSAVQWRDGDAWIRLQNGDTTAVLVFRDVPAYTIHVDDPDLPAITGTFEDFAGSISLSGGELRLERGLSLQSFGGLPVDRIERIEVHHDWLLVQVPTYHGIRFLERLEEESR